MYGTFLKEYVETVEDLYSQPYNIDGRQQNIDFIDTAGNISFPAMRQIYISKAHGFILVYSISDKNSYEEMDRKRRGPFCLLLVFPNCSKRILKMS
jgi:GTPase SAR1 family protein